MQRSHGERIYTSDEQAEEFETVDDLVKCAGKLDLDNNSSNLNINTEVIVCLCNNLTEKDIQQACSCAHDAEEVYTCLDCEPA